MTRPNLPDRLLPGCLILVAFGCESYQPLPLDAEQVLQDLMAERAAPRPTLTLANVQDHLRNHNAAVVAAWALHREKAAVARIQTPLPNPVITAGPTVLDGSNITSSNRWGLEAALGWALPLSGRRSTQDDIHALEEHLALAEAMAVERREYLALRWDWGELAFAGARIQVAEAMVQTLATTAQVQRRLAEAARTSALDLRMVELEHQRAADGLLTAKEGLLLIRGELARRSGLPLPAWSTVTAVPKPLLPEQVPSLEDLQRLLLEEPQLMVLRARYLLAEKRLHLEVQKQLPDLLLGPLFEREGNINKWGLTVGIEVPLLDRNRQGIAQARAQRAGIRRGFEALLRERLTAVETARGLVLLRAQRLDLLRQKVVPLQAELEQILERMRTGGLIDALRLLELMRLLRGVRLDVLAAERAHYQAWTGLEQACGAPLLRVPGEPEKDKR